MADIKAITDKLEQGVRDVFSSDNYKEDDEMYLYGMRLRGFAPMCQPMNGFVERLDDTSGKYHDLLVYNRELEPAELRAYELDYLGEHKGGLDNV